MTNRLARESSPYLLQHQENPVEWYPWGEEALAAARAADKPILLSIGYSACHWCHVMAHESFEDPDTAALMNQLYINIKVDREERPDIDGIYMDAVTAMTGHGGWPLTVFLTPEGVPFYGGTYYPPEPRYGMPSFRQVLTAVSDAYTGQRAQIAEQGEKLLAHIRQRTLLASGDYTLNDEIPARAFEQLVRAFDARWGGFGASGPKFPQPMVLEFLLRYYDKSADIRARRVLDTTLTRMAHGGMYDHLGGGFARYSVDEKWLVPHFEKMLYDNGQLASLYLRSYQALGNPLYKRVAEETLAYLQREMIDPQGGFYSSQDADSEGEEGKFFVWRVEEIERLLTPEEARIVKAFYAVTPGGNFEGHSVLWIPTDPATVAANLNLSERVMQERLNSAKAKLFEARSQRIAPGTDTKILVSWNSLAISAFAEASQILHNPEFAAVAARAAHFILDTMRAPDGRLHRTWKAEPGVARLNGYLEDYAYLIVALTHLYEATFDSLWLREAHALAEIMLADFSDDKGGFYDTGRSHETLVVRPKDVLDNAMPGGNSMATLALLRLGAYLDAPAYHEAAERALNLLGQAMGEQPQAFGHWLVALAWYLAPTVELAFVGAREGVESFLDTVYRHFLPHKIMVYARDDNEAAMLGAEIPLLRDRSQLEEAPTAYLCDNFACRQPVTTAAALEQQLKALRDSAQP